MKAVKPIFILMLAFLAFSFCAAGKPFFHVEKMYFLKGKVGENEIVLRMLCYDEMPTRFVHYFFLNDKKDHYLVGRQKDKFWNFTPGEKGGGNSIKQSGVLNIAENKNGLWNGTWTDSSGKTWNLILSAIIADSIHSNFSQLLFIKELDPYESYRLSTISFSKTKSEKRTDGLYCDWYQEKESGISFFRLRSTNKMRNADSVNSALETTHLSLVERYFQYVPQKTTTKVETALRYLTNELVSFRIVSTTSFSETKTSQVRELFTLDVESGQPVALEDILWFDKTAAKPPADDLYKIYKYRKNVFAPNVFALLRELYPLEMKNDSCGINKEETWTLPEWNLTSKGIALSFRTPEQCGVESWAVIPYKKLEPFMEKKYRLQTGR